MKHTWVPYVAIAAGAALLLKAVLIIGNGDGDFGGVSTTFMYLGGLILALVAAVGFGLNQRVADGYQRVGRRSLVAIGSVALLILWVMGISDLTAPVFEAVIGDEVYVGDEGPVGLLGAVLIALGARARMTERQSVLA